MSGRLTEQKVERIARAIELMRLAASVLQEFAPDAEVFYDEADCDGSCLAEDLEACAEDLANQCGKS
jgi:hypothetical protein